ncbi:MAG: AraC family transcriptional regulator [Xanthobacteraceae bacterium]
MADYGATRVELPRFDAVPSRGNSVGLTDLTLGYSVCGEATIEFPEADFARQQFALRGSCGVTSGRMTSQVTCEQTCITSPGRTATIAYGRDFEQFYIRVARTALERKLAALLGAPANGPLTFAINGSMADPRVQGLWQLTKFLADQLNASAGRLPQVVLRELEQAVVLAFLCSNEHSFSVLLQRDIADATPRQVRLVEEFIRAHCDQAITIEQLAGVSGVSARTLFKTFRRHRGYSPHQFAKRVRLERARDMLIDTDPTTTITGVAFACGFANLGHFAHDYRAAFGELPSAILARATTRRSARAATDTGEAGAPD